MRQYRYHFLAALILSSLGTYLLYEFNVLDEYDFLWPTVVICPLVTLVIMSFIRFEGSQQDNTYNTARVSAVKKSASTPLKILQSPVLWFGVISIGVVVFAFSM